MIRGFVYHLFIAETFESISNWSMGSSAQVIDAVAFSAPLRNQALHPLFRPQQSAGQQLGAVGIQIQRSESVGFPWSQYFYVFGVLGTASDDARNTMNK